MDMTSQHNFLTKQGVNLAEIINKRVAIVGLGGLGSHLANSMIRLGFENVLLIDGDVVEGSNISRQTLFSHNDIGRSKAITSKESLSKINPRATIDVQDTYLYEYNKSILKGTDIILDGTDNLEVRRLINRISLLNDTPWIQAAAIGSSGTTTTFIPGDSACYECLYGDGYNEPVSCSSEGILITTLMSIVSIQVNEAVKVLSGLGDTPVIRNFDFWNGTTSKMDISLLKNNECKACSDVSTFVPIPIRIICDGHVKDVRTFDTDSIEESIPRDYVITNKNKLFTEYTNKTNRIVVYGGNKVSFYNLEDDFILDLCS